MQKMMNAIRIFAKLVFNYLVLANILS